MSDLFNGLTLQLLTRSLDADALNHTLIANNIANINTPGYHRMEVAFKDQLKDFLDDKKFKLKLAKTDPRHLDVGAPTSIDDLQPKIETDNDSEMRADGNNVDIDKEMVKLSQNSGEYTMLTSLVAGQFSSLQAAIEGR